MLTQLTSLLSLSATQHPQDPKSGRDGVDDFGAIFASYAENDENHRDLEKPPETSLAQEDADEPAHVDGDVELDKTAADISADEPDSIAREFPENKIPTTPDDFDFDSANMPQNLPQISRHSDSSNELKAIEHVPLLGRTSGAAASHVFSDLPTRQAPPVHQPISDDVPLHSRGLVGPVSPGLGNDLVSPLNANEGTEFKGTTASTTTEQKHDSAVEQKIPQPEQNERKVSGTVEQDPVAFKSAPKDGSAMPLGQSVDPKPTPVPKPAEVDASPPVLAKPADAKLPLVDPKTTTSSREGVILPVLEPGLKELSLRIPTETPRQPTPNGMVQGFDAKSGHPIPSTNTTPATSFVKSDKTSEFVVDKQLIALNQQEPSIRNADAKTQVVAPTGIPENKAVFIRSEASSVAHSSTLALTTPSAGPRTVSLADPVDLVQKPNDPIIVSPNGDATQPAQQIKSLIETTKSRITQTPLTSLEPEVRTATLTQTLDVRAPDNLAIPRDPAHPNMQVQPRTQTLVSAPVIHYQDTSHTMALKNNKDSLEISVKPSQVGEKTSADVVPKPTDPKLVPNGNELLKPLAKTADAKVEIFEHRPQTVATTDKNPAPLTLSPVAGHQSGIPPKPTPESGREKRTDTGSERDRWAIKTTDLGPQTSVQTTAPTPKTEMTHPIQLQQAQVNSPMLADMLEQESSRETLLATFGTESRAASTHHVGSTSLPARPDVAPILRQIADAMPQLNDRGIELRLSPEELGRVHMQLVQTESGLTVHINADRPETLDLMRRHIDQLAKDLADAGFENSGFSFGDSPSGHQQQHGQDSPEDLNIPIAVLENQPMAVTSDGLDIRI